MKLSEKLFFSHRPTLLWCFFLLFFLIVYASSALRSEAPIVVGKTQMNLDDKIVGTYMIGKYAHPTGKGVQVVKPYYCLGFSSLFREVKRP
jgi:hypothetical protein